MTLPLSEHSCCIVDSSPTIARDTNDAFAPDLWAFENPEPINPRFNVNYTRFLHYLQKFCKAGPAKITLVLYYSSCKFFHRLIGCSLNDEIFENKKY